MADGRIIINQKNANHLIPLPAGVNSGREFYKPTNQR